MKKLLLACLLMIGCSHKPAEPKMKKLYAAKCTILSKQQIEAIRTVTLRVENSAVEGEAFLQTGNETKLLVDDNFWLDALPHNQVFILVRVDDDGTIHSFFVDGYYTKHYRGNNGTEN